MKKSHGDVARKSYKQSLYQLSCFITDNLKCIVISSHFWLREFLHCTLLKEWQRYNWLTIQLWCYCNLD